MKLLSFDDEDIEIDLLDQTIVLTMNFASKETACRLFAALVETARQTGGMHIRAGTAKRTEPGFTPLGRLP